MEIAQKVLIFFLQLAFIWYFTDTWLYWTHRLYHWEKSPAWFRKIHDYHHNEFKRIQVFKLHWAEWIISSAVPIAMVFYFWGWWVLLTYPWSIFEAMRGHGHFKWFRLIPKGYYKNLKFCGIKYHMYHHEIDETKNFGQFLKVWDVIMGTKAEAPKCMPQS